MVELTPRRIRLLRHLVEEYVTTAQPVASELLHRKYEPDVSSATIRNELAVLEEAGLVSQPHTSAGRTPTDQGYRLFVERVMGDALSLSEAERAQLRSQFAHPASAPDAAVHRASGLLAQGLQSAALATQSTGPRAVLRRLELVPLQADVVLVTLILQSGGVRQLVHRLDRPTSQDELARLSNELSDLLSNHSASQTRRAVPRLHALAGTFADLAADLLQAAEEQAFASISLEGLTQLLSQPEFREAQKLRPILEVLEQQPLLARFLAETLATPGVQVIIGAENRLEQMREATLVLARYGSDDEYGGIVGVVGPTRLPYWRAVPMVAFISELMGHLGAAPAPAQDDPSPASSDRRAAGRG